MNNIKFIKINDIIDYSNKLDRISQNSNKLEYGKRHKNNKKDEFMNVLMLF